jgi:isopentenyl phosphate kinase
MKDKSIIFVKIGGSLITDKNKPFSLKKKVLETICREIKESEKHGKKIVLGHGAGSFAHIPAKKYKTHLGIIDEQSYRGIAEVADVAAQLNRIVVKYLLDAGVNGVSVSPLSMMTSNNFELDTISIDAIEELLKHDLVPVLYGDQIMDKSKGCTIFSTERVLGYLALEMKSKGYEVEKIIHCGLTSGVYDEDGKTIPEINGANFEKYKRVLGGSGGVDVTGGMIHKVEETLALAKKGIPGMIIDGVENGSLAEAIEGKEVLGTKVEG